MKKVLTIPKIDVERFRRAHKIKTYREAEMMIRGIHIDKIVKVMAA